MECVARWVAATTTARSAYDNPAECALGSHVALPHLDGMSALPDVPAAYATLSEIR